MCIRDRVNPSKLSQTFENQMNFFTMEHENQYGEQINELINIFIPPENASAEEMEDCLLYTSRCV